MKEIQPASQPAMKKEQTMKLKLLNFQIHVNTCLYNMLLKI